MEEWQRLSLDFAFRALRALAVLAGGGLAVWFVAGPFRRMLARSRLDPSSASFLANTGRGVLLVAVVLIALDQLGVQTTSLIALLGAAGLAVGLALQGSLANFASGLLLLSFRTVRIGDWIEVGGARGQVRDMHPFHIVIVSEDNRVVTIPNTLLTGGAVANDSALPTRRVRWTLPVSGRDDLAAAREALTARIRADPRVLAEPAPAGLRRGLGRRPLRAGSDCLDLRRGAPCGTAGFAGGVGQGIGGGASTHRREAGDLNAPPRRFSVWGCSHAESVAQLPPGGAG